MSAREKKTRFLIPLGTPSKPGKGSPIARVVLQTLVFPIFWLIGKIYKLCFGWLDRLIARKNQDRFIREIRSHLSFLFTDYGATIIPNEGVPFPPSFDGAYVTLALNAFLLRFSRGRGEFGVMIASKYAPEDWENIELLFEAMEQSKEPPQTHPTYYVLESFGQMLQPRFDSLERALSKENFEATLDHAVRIHNQRADEYIAKLQQQGISPKFY